MRTTFFARRALLQSLGATGLAQFLPSLYGNRSARAGSTVPKRLVIFTNAHGTLYQNWKMRTGAPSSNDSIPNDWEAPLGSLAASDFSPILKPLYPHRNKMMVIDGLAMHTAYQMPHDANGHQTGGITCLTGGNIADFSLNTGTGPSIDQIVAKAISAPTQPKASVQILQASGSESDYLGSIRDQNGKPILGEGDMAALYSRLFPNDGSAPPVSTPMPSPSMPSTPAPAADPFAAGRGAALDFVKGQFGDVAGRLGGDDRKKLQSHMDLISSLRTRLGGSGGSGMSGGGGGGGGVVPYLPASCSPGNAPAPGIPALKESFAQTIPMVARALHCDVTRVITIECGGPELTDIGSPAGDFHSDVAHHCDDGVPQAGFPAGGAADANLRNIATKYHAFNAQLVADLVGTLDATMESDGTTLLDNTLVVWTSVLATGGHDYAIWPVVTFGGSALGFKNGRNVYFGQSNPTTSGNQGGAPTLGPGHNQFLVSIAQAFGLTLNQVGNASVTSPSGKTVSLTGPLGRLKG